MHRKSAQLPFRPWNRGTLPVHRLDGIAPTKHSQEKYIAKVVS